MTYNKPTIAVLGEAVRVIQDGKSGPSTDAPLAPGIVVTPAYDLDE